MRWFMKNILFISDMSTHYPKSMIDAFEYYGFRVNMPKYEKFQEANRLIKFFYKRRHQKKYIEKFRSYNIHKLEESNPDFVFIVNDYFMDEIFFELCEKKNIPVYGYCQDALKYCNKAMEGNDVFRHLKHYTAYYSYEPTDVQYKVKGGNSVKYMPLGFDERFFHVQKATAYDMDIFFAGSLDRLRKEILNGVARYAKQTGLNMVVKTGIQLFNCESPLLFFKLFMRRLRFRLSYPYLYEVIDNKFSQIEELAQLYARSRFCINIHYGVNPEEHTGPNPRTFETMAAGTCLITDEDHLYGTDFKDGRDIVTFSDVNELISKLDYYIHDDDARMRIAMAGKAKVWSSYTERTLINRFLKQERLI